MRKIQASELAMPKHGGYVICGGGLFGRIKPADGFSLAVEPDTCHVSGLVSALADSLVLMGGTSGSLTVAKVLREGAKAQVLPAVIESVAVYMVNDLTFARTHDHAMQQDPTMATSPYVFVLVTNPKLKPFVLAEQDNICVIYQAIAAISKRDSGHLTALPLLGRESGRPNHPLLSEQSVADLLDFLGQFDRNSIFPRHEPADRRLRNIKSDGGSFLRSDPVTEVLNSFHATILAPNARHCKRRVASSASLFTLALMESWGNCRAPTGLSP